MHAVGTFDANGNIADMNELRKQRRKKGLCVECGDVKTHKMSFGGMKSTPLTHEYAMKGRCLRCFPLQQIHSSEIQRNSYYGSGRGSGTVVVNNYKSNSSSHAIDHASSRLERYGSNISASNSVTASQSASGSNPYANHSANAISKRSCSEASTQAQGEMRLTVKKDSYSYKIAQRQQQMKMRESQQMQGSINGSGNSFTNFVSSNEENRYSTRSQILNKSSNALLTEGRASAIRTSFFTNEYPTQLCVSDEDPFEILRNTHDDIQSVQLSSKGCEEKDRQSTLKMSRSVRDVTRIMHSYPDNTVIQEESVKALASAAEKQSQCAPSSRNIDEQEFINYNISPLVDELIQAMSNVPESGTVQEFACRAFWALTTKPAVQIMLTQSDGLSLIVEAMSSYPANKSLQHNACSVLSNLSSNEDNIDTIGQASNAISVLLQTIKKFAMDQPLLLVACGTLANLTVSEANRVVVSDFPEGLVILCDTMVTHGKEILLQEQLLKILRNISAGSETHKEAIHNCDGIEAIIMIMRTHPSERKIQMLCCWTLSNLAVSKPLKRVIGELGALNLIIDVIWEQEQDASIVEWACRALWSLAVDPMNKEQIGKATGIDAIVSGMNRHRTNTGVQEKGCGALSNLAANSDTNKVIIANSEGIDAIKYAMETHPSHEGIQEKGCLALRKLATENTVPLMMCLDIRQLLDHAINTFPVKCAERAQFVVDKMEEFGS